MCVGQITIRSMTWNTESPIWYLSWLTKKVEYREIEPSTMGIKSGDNWDESSKMKFQLGERCAPDSRIVKVHYLMGCHTCWPPKHRGFARVPPERSTSEVQDARLLFLAPWMLLVVANFQTTAMQSQVMSHDFVDVGFQQYLLGGSAWQDGNNPQVMAGVKCTV